MSTLFGKSVCKYSQVKMRSYWIRVVLNPMTGILIRKGERDLDMETEHILQEGHVNPDAEAGAKQLQTKERGGLLATAEARGGRNSSSCRGFRDSPTLLMPLFHTFGLQNHQRINFCSIMSPRL